MERSLSCLGLASVGLAALPVACENVGTGLETVDGITHLTSQGWSKAQRQDFYHASQGTRLLPYAWFVALESPASAASFLDEANLRALGVIPDSDPVGNPDLLPVGFAKTVDESAADTDPWRTSVGLTCAACHTAEVQYGNLRIRVDGGPATIDALALPAALGMALGATLQDKEKFQRFQSRVLGPEADPASVQELASAVAAFVQRMQQQKALAEQKKLYPTAWGHGRLDALGRGGNTVLARLSPENLRPADAPVSFPALWGAHDLEWVQWNGAIMQPLARNVSESIGVGAALQLEPGPNQFASTVDVEQMARIEALVATLGAPEWPESVFGAIDKDKAEHGRSLYKEICVRCHDQGRSAPNEFAGTFKAVGLVTLDEVGTDPVAASNFSGRQVDTGVLGLGTVSAAEAIKSLTEGIAARQFRERGIPAERQVELVGNRPNLWRAPAGYLARPHLGVWALGPYLHNGSVPNLHELLGPASQRSKEFHVGNTEFDPVRVGFVSDRPGAGTSAFSVELPGNSNQGHEFTNAPSGTKGVVGRALSDEERLALIEFLKTM